MSAPSDVRLSNVSVSFDTVRALQDVDLDIGDGEFFTLVGPSGCGKTTTLRVVAGFAKPDSGTVEIGGVFMDDVPPEDRPVGIVFQNTALFPHMTVQENIAYGLRFTDPPGDVTTADRVEALLDLVDMSGMGARAPETLSGGQAQRVALARALAPGPDVLLLDEPMSALDARLRQRLRLTIREIQRELDTTTVYVTHDQAEALAISDRVAVINEGRIEQVGTPETVYRKPASRFVAEFVGDTNLLTGTVTRTTQPSLSVNGHTLALPPGADVSEGSEITLCVRPETFRILDEDDTDGLPVVVESVEFTGETYRVHCESETVDRSLLVTTRTQEPPAGPKRLGVDPERVHILQE